MTQPRRGTRAYDAKQAVNAERRKRDGRARAEWQRTRQAVLDRDAHTCQLVIDNRCTVTANTVHRIGGGEHTTNPDEYVSACRHCHGVIDAHRRDTTPHTTRPATRPATQGGGAPREGATHPPKYAQSRPRGGFSMPPHPTHTRGGMAKGTPASTNSTPRSAAQAAAAGSSPAPANHHTPTTQPILLPWWVNVIADSSPVIIQRGHHTQRPTHA